jgi:hypothetical protein
MAERVMTASQIFARISWTALGRSSASLSGRESSGGATESSIAVVAAQPGEKFLALGETRGEELRAKQHQDDLGRVARGKLAGVLGRDAPFLPTGNELIGAQ